MTFKQALAIQESSLGSHHPEVAVTLIKLAGLYKKLGRVSDAEQAELRADNIRGK
jgi:hypothetical protein